MAFQCNFFVVFKKKVFEDFRMEGFSAEQNEIYAEVNSDELNRALKSASTAKVLKIKLTKKNVPYLTMEMKIVKKSKNLKKIYINIAFFSHPYRPFHEPSSTIYRLGLYLRDYGRNIRSRKFPNSMLASTRHTSKLFKKSLGV